MKNPFKTFARALALLGAVLPLRPAQTASLALDQDFRTPLFAEAYPAGNTLLLPDGKYLLFGTTTTLCDQRTGVLTRYLPDGTLDPSFNFSRDYKFVAAAASASNGQLIVAAYQYLYDGFRTAQIIRLNTDGSIDSSFNTAIVGSENISVVRAITIQPDGKILVAGLFDTFAGLARQKIVRLLPDGTLDSGFIPPQFSAGPAGIYAKPVVLANGKILVAGDFSNVNGVARPGVTQLNADGSVDSGFQPSGFARSGNGTPIRGLVVQSDGKIVLGGRFNIGGPVRVLVRLNTDGSADTSYLAPIFGTTTARDLVIQPDDKVVAAITNSIYRFTTTGSLDTSFAQPTVVLTTLYSPGELGTPLVLSLQSDGRILMAGTFTDVNPSGGLDGSHFGLARLNSDGTLDPTLVTSHKTGLEDFPSTFARQPDGSTIIAFGIQSIKNEPAMRINLGRLLPNGQLDPSFSLSSSKPDSVLSQGFVTQDFAQLADGRLFVWGTTPDLGFTAAMFLSNGTEDRTFDFNATYFQRATAVPDGEVLLSAGTDPQATVLATLSRMNRDGSFDASFALPGSIMSEQVIRNDEVGIITRLYVGSHVLAIQADGKILFEYFSSDGFFHLLRLNTDGSVDNSFAATTLAPFDLTQGFPFIFDPWTGQTRQPPDGAWNATPPVADAQILPDGRIILCGPFTSFNGVAARGVVRLLANGTVDNTFAVGGGAQWTQTAETSSFFPAVEGMEQQVDGKLLIVGTFEAFNGTALPGIASLNSDGSVDPSFTPLVKRQKFDRGATRFARQPDGSFLLSGPYGFPNESEPTFIHINSIGGVPIVGSPPLATTVAGQFFSYQIVASGQPTSYSASGLPPGFSIDPATGLITGTPGAANVGTYTITITATNTEGTSATFQLVLTVLPPATPTTLLNISTRLRVLTGDNALIGGFIITGTAPKRVIVRAIGPSLTDFGISGALADPVLELHGPGGFITITNNNWRDTQQSEIEFTGIPPSNDLESAIVATLPPGAYTAIVRGLSDGTGVGLVEAYDLDSAANSKLANISTRGFVDTGENVMIGGLIGGPASAGGGPMLVRAIGPSLTGFGVPNALQDPTLELRDGHGNLIASNNDWRDTHQAAIESTGIPPSEAKESAILSTLAPGTYTAIVRGTNNGTGVGLVEVYNLQ